MVAVFIFLVFKKTTIFFFLKTINFVCLCVAKAYKNLLYIVAIFRMCAVHCNRWGNGATKKIATEKRKTADINYILI